MYLYFAILIAVVVIILLLIKKSINSFPSKLVSTTTEEQYQLDEETQFTTEETQFAPNEIADGQYKISILYNWGYFKIKNKAVALTNDSFKIRTFIIQGNNFLVTPDSKSFNLDPLPLQISSTGMLSLDYVTQGNELNFEQVNALGGYYINIKGTELYLCCLANQNLVFNKRPIEYKNMRIFAIPMDDNFVDWKDDYPNFNPFIFYFRLVN